MITQTQPVTHPKLPGVMIYPLNEEMLQAGKPQQVLVYVEPNGLIPSHNHDCDATMFIVAGDAQVISDDPEFNGRHVGLGSRVFFQKKRNHGFLAGVRGLKFISTNNGIVDGGGNWDLQFTQ